LKAIEAQGVVSFRRSSPAAVAASIGICVAAAAGYVFYVGRYSSDGVYWDDWNWVDMVRRAQDGTLGLQDLWAQHNEARMLFPNLIAIAIAEASGFNDVSFMYLGAALLLVTVLLLAIACRRELSSHPWAYVPAVFVLLSLAQYENTLWGFQFAWFLVTGCIAAVLLLLTGPKVSVPRFAAAVALGVVGSFSLFQGLEIWLAGLVALTRPGNSTKMRSAWFAAGAVTAVVYFAGLNLSLTGGPPLSQFPTHIPTALLGLLVAIGSVMPNVLLVTPSGDDFTITIAFGALMTVAGAAVLTSWWRDGRNDRTMTVAAALIGVGFVFDILLMPGRLSGGLINGTPSRYTTFNLLLLAGVYLGAVRSVLLAMENGRWRSTAVTGVLASVAAALVCIQIATGTVVGLARGKTTMAEHAEAANLTANYEVAPPSLVAFFVYPPSFGYFQAEAEFLLASHMNVFRNGEASTYRQTGVLAGGAVSSPLPVPTELGDIRSSTTEWRAWLAMTSVYEQRPDLQAAFPGGKVETSRRMVAWVVMSGMDPHDPIYAPVLTPYSDQYKIWMSDVR
jgi:hypothetical protein